MAFKGGKTNNSKYNLKLHSARNKLPTEGLWNFVLIQSSIVQEVPSEGRPGGGARE